MTRRHSDCCDCERCHPSEEALKFLAKSKTKKLSPGALYSRRKQQEHRVASELRALSTQDFASTPQRVTRSGRSAIVTASVSPETLTVVQNIIQRYKEKHSVFFTHLEIQIMFFWHTYQALTGELMDPALPMMITGVLTPYATDMELHNQATEKLRSERDSTDQARTSDLNEMVRLLAANGAELRIWETLTQGTMFYFKASNIAVAQIPSTSTSTFTSPVTETSNEISIQTAQSPAVCEEASPTPDMIVVETSQTETRLEQLEEENFLLTEKVYCLEDERAQFQEEWENMARKLKESEAENQRLRSVLEASLQIFAEPWESLKDKYGN
ncbi:uncharacterized protein N7473_004721 [Penicillium subrubescens]|uniref:Uncharacterized protein n=1 Tax=Penicillium subrubescens TaxID=1316194 RepID=A0A1Q5UHK1_9EURO|nr:uncharacterized protein N7473_004721 [Penicillium subrubescens]KAJ5900651.1 hypothetical protein N7473_004721 [Penicillium subrubescens]OKP11956.1 hypothetical protein PENSUB_2508 [Penicillium subrubescens]